MEQYALFLMCLQEQIFELGQTGNTINNKILQYVRLYVALFSESDTFCYSFTRILLSGVKKFIYLFVFNRLRFNLEESVSFRCNVIFCGVVTSNNHKVKSTFRSYVMFYSNLVLYNLCFLPVTLNMLYYLICSH
jgi:hypothetical protein